MVRYGFLGICAAKGTPQPILDLLNRHIVSIVATPDYRDLIEKGRLPAGILDAGRGLGKSRHRRWTTLRLQSANSECSRNRLRQEQASVSNRLGPIRMNRENDMTIKLDG